MNTILAAIMGGFSALTGIAYAVDAGQLPLAVTQAATQSPAQWGDICKVSPVKPQGTIQGTTSGSKPVELQQAACPPKVIELKQMPLGKQQKFNFKRVDSSEYPEVYYNTLRERQMEIATLPKAQVMTSQAAEFVPLLILQYKTAKLPAILISEDRSIWAGAFTDLKNPKCVYIVPFMLHVCE